MDKVRRFFSFDDDYDVVSGEGSEESLVASIQDTAVHRGVRPTGGRANLVALPAAKKAAKHEILIVEPRAMAQAQEIAGAMKSGKSVLLNLSRADKELCRRMVDFLYGINFAIEGHSRKIAEQIYLFTTTNLVINSFDSEGDEVNSEAVPTVGPSESRTGYPGGYR